MGALRMRLGAGHVGWAQRAGPGLRGVAGPGSALGIPARGPGLLVGLPLIAGGRIKKGKKVRGLEVPRGDRAARLADGIVFAPRLPAVVAVLGSCLRVSPHRAFPDAGTRIPRSSPALWGHRDQGAAAAASCDVGAGDVVAAFALGFCSTPTAEPGRGRWVLLVLGER